MNPFDAFDQQQPQGQTQKLPVVAAKPNAFDKFDTQAPSTQKPQGDPGILRNLGAGLEEGLIGLGTQAHEMLDPATNLGELANATGRLFGKKDDVIPEKYIPGSYEQTNEALRPVGLAPEDVRAPNAADRIARTTGTGLSAVLTPGGEGELLPTLGQLGGRAFAGASSGFTSGVAQEAVPDPYKHLAGFVGAVAGGVPGMMAGERMFGAPTGERANRLQQTQQLGKDFSASGVPTEGAAAAITGSRALGATQAGLANFFTSAQTIGDAARKTLNGFRNFAGRVASGYGDADTQEQAGQALQSGSKSFVKSFNDKANKLYGVLDRYVSVKPTNADRFVTQFTGKPLPSGIPVSLSNTAKMIGDRLGPFANTPTIQSVAVPPKLSGIMDDIGANNGQVPWQTAKDLRSMIGEKLDSFGDDDTGIPRATWGKLYGALSDDMQAAVADKGPEAQRAFDRANAFYAAGRHRIDNFIRPIMNSPAAEKAATAAMSGSAQGATMLRALRKSLPPDDWGDFAGYQLRKMGLAKPSVQDASGEAFSPGTFLTNWSKLAPESKDALFGGTQYADLRPQLDRLARMSGAMKGVEGMANTSKTAGTLGTLEAIGSGAAALTHPVGTAAALATPWATAKLMTSPAFVKYLTWRAGQIAARKPVNPLVSQNMLRSVAKSEPQIADDVKAYLKQSAGAAGQSGQQARGSVGGISAP